MPVGPAPAECFKPVSLTGFDSASLNRRTRPVVELFTRPMPLSPQATGSSLDVEHFLVRFGGPGEPPLPSYEDFHTNYMAKNRLCVFSYPLEPAFTEWTLEDAESEGVQDAVAGRRGTRRPNYDLLARRYGDIEVQPAGTTPSTFRHFLHGMQNGEQIYLRDWHLVSHLRSTGNHQKPYTTPLWFKDDWLNAFLDSENTDPASRSDDYRFVYMGASGTSTLLHVDVFNSYSWSANICGTKKWTFFPPEQTRYLTNARGETITDLRDVTPDEHPQYFENATPVVIHQHAGELIFVPSSWWHQVENIGETMSINHNWCNATNLPNIFENLASDLAYIREAIAEHREQMGEREWGEHCQLMLKANNAGFGYRMLGRFWRFHARRLLGLIGRGTGDGELDEHASDTDSAPWLKPKLLIESLAVLNDVWQLWTRDEWVLSILEDEDAALSEHMQTILAPTVAS
ncbi:uncharacterized protein EV422DRAFT_508790 [Fimicolochytrium jonesii]|uniref:uncharacterized protein n=1 Tax=Fimicolochytrium jonesii TaxID=1396493 RepID=UPI0022FDB716|nr:uncharacterized protein EV422DRAFT_508790 [Fimicolochytrium jonesii]KAI8817719.1 hypothetical protein EV422DRAFT_508790 [Fimicolochytrium jonesii]